MSLVSFADEELAKYTSSILDGSTVCTATMVVGGPLCKKRIECDTITLGALTRSLLTAGILPVIGRDQSLTVRNMIKAFRSMTGFGKEIAESSPHRSITHAKCGPMSRFKERADSVSKELQGLKLSSFRFRNTRFFQ